MMGLIQGAGMSAFLFSFEESISRVDNFVGRVEDSVCCVCVMGSGVFCSDRKRVN